MKPKVTQCYLHSINIRKIKFIANFYICFNQNLEEKFYIMAKIEAIKHYMQFICLLWNSADVQSDWFILTTLTLRGSMLLHSKVYYRAFSLNIIFFISKVTTCTINTKFNGIRQQARAYRRLLLNRAFQ